MRPGAVTVPNGNFTEAVLNTGFGKLSYFDLVIWAT